MNALDMALKEALRDTLAELETDRSCRAVVLAGAGRAFCAGQDLREHVAHPGSSGAADPLATVRAHYNPIAARLADLPKPVVAAVRGMAAGAGASLAFLADFRIGGPTTSFLMAFAKVGPGRRHRRLLDAAPAGRPRQGDRAADAGRAGRRRRGLPARPAHPAGRRRRAGAAGRAGAGRPARRRPDRRVRGDQAAALGRRRRHARRRAGRRGAGPGDLRRAPPTTGPPPLAFVAKQKPVFEGR